MTKKQFVSIRKNAFSSSRQPQYVWKHSQSDVIRGDDNSWQTHLLDMDWFYPGGVHIWSVEIEDTIEGDIMLGIVANVDNLVLDTFLGYQHGGWSFGGYDGVRYEGDSCRAIRWSNSDDSDDEEDSLKLQKGSIVTFVLDLTCNKGNNGTLSISIGSTTRLLCSNLLDFQHKKEQQPKNQKRPLGFLPAVSMFYNDDRVKFLGFELRLDLTTSSLSVG
mmetsp:Transcript_9422/g.14574  ORF Transcript_9422/g.14574 Transcript_9422/m.14574 type:complete len:218 (+) Transcript_9422:136-789(+)